MLPALQVPGGTDCELIAGGLVAQPVAMATSLAYVVAGVAVAARAGTQRRAALVYGIVLVLVGVGSIAYHGPQPAWSRWAHDLPIAVLFLLIAAVDLHRLDRLRGWRWPIVAGAGSAILGLLFAIVPDAAGPATALLVAGAVVTEVAVHRHRHRRRGERTPVNAGRFPAVFTAVVPLALIAYALGRTGSPLCDPGGFLQLHGLWHVLSAIALGLWPAATGLLDDGAGRNLAGTVPSP